MTSAIIVAAGKGTRMGFKKQFMEICGAPLISHTLKVFEISEADEIIIVTSEQDVDDMKKIASEYGISKLTAVVAGGKERSDSVMNGLKAAQGEYVMIHDGVRPFIKPEEISHLISEVKKHDAVCAGYAVKDTIKVVDENGFIKSTPERSTLFAAATPQCFKTSVIKEAYKHIADNGVAITDDCMAAEYVGVRVKTVPCSYENIKITTVEDITTAEAIFAKRRNLK